MRHSAKKSTCDTQLFHVHTPAHRVGVGVGGGELCVWVVRGFGAVSVGYAQTPFCGNPRLGKGVNPRFRFPPRRRPERGAAFAGAATGAAGGGDRTP